MSASVAELIDGYEEGRFTRSEVVGSSLDLLDEEATRREVWGALPEWVKEDIVVILDGFSESSKVTLFDAGDPEVAKQSLLALKAWLRANRIGGVT